MVLAEARAESCVAHGMIASVRVRGIHTRATHRRLRPGLQKSNKAHKLAQKAVVSIARDRILVHADGKRRRLLLTAPLIKASASLVSESRVEGLSLRTHCRALLWFSRLFCFLFFLCLFCFGRIFVSVRVVRAVMFDDNGEALAEEEAPRDGVDEAEVTLIINILRGKRETVAATADALVMAVSLIAQREATGVVTRVLEMQREMIQKAGLTRENASLLIESVLQVSCLRACSLFFLTGFFISSLNVRQMCRVAPQVVIIER